MSCSIEACHRDPADMQLLTEQLGCEHDACLRDVAGVVLVGKSEAAQSLFAAKGSDCSHHPLLHLIIHFEAP